MTNQTLISRYSIAKNAAVGSHVKCPYCGNVFIKTTYNKVFCSNAKTRKRRNCKDMYWNTVDPEKACRDTPFYRAKLEASYDPSDSEYWDHKDF